jgi:hypothetical protein
VNPEDARLLKRFEPVLKFTQGEQFFPYNVRDYVTEASLWVKRPDLPPEQLLSEKALTLETLGDIRQRGVDSVHYMQFISPMNIRELAEFRLQRLRESRKKRLLLATRSRLTRVGYFSRFVDALFSVSLLLRGRVPGDALAAAVVTFDEMLRKKREFQYYGRVVRDGGWIVLQYWFFYPFNNWRSGFFGGNDHEADWEMINIYLCEDGTGNIRPVWVAYASHDFSGDDLRRHWQDPEVEKVGEHPVVYVGGGSHASYFQKGEYLTQITLPFLTPVKNFITNLEKFFRQLFGEKNSGTPHHDSRINVFKVPFVDYAQGNGLCIGFGCDETWAAPEVIDPPPDWVKNFRGLWGYYAQDPFSGENAPAGPMYQRDGTVRKAWYDPLGWSGMDSVMPPGELSASLKERQGKIRGKIRLLLREIEKIQDEVYQLGLDLQAMRDAYHLRKTLKEGQKTLSAKQEILSEKRKSLTIQKALLESLRHYEADIGDHPSVPIRGHIAHPHRPQVKQALRFGKLAEFWAAISIGLMMIVVVVLIVFARQFLLVGLGGLLMVLVTLEAAFRKRLWALVRNIGIILALLSALILIYEFFWTIIVVAVMLTGLYMIIENLRELFSRS